MANDKALKAARQAIRYLSHPETPWSDEQVQAAISAYLSALTGEAEVDDFIRKLRDFETAYGEEFFTPLTEAEKAKVGGELRSRIAADMGRHLAKFFVEAADALQAMQARADAAERERDEAIISMGEHARARGEAEGKLHVSELAGIIEGWKSRAEAAEARVKKLEALVEQAFRDGLAYGSNTENADPDVAWGHSRARANLNSRENKE